MRGKQAPRRTIKPDQKYNNLHIAKFIRYVMERGKLSVAEHIVYGAFAIIEEKAKRDPLEVFDAAMKNITPSVEVKSRRVGGANYQMPIEVRGDRRFALASRWILTSARTKKGKPMAERLAGELLAASRGEGDAMKKKDDVQRMAEANRAFAHFAR